MSKQTNSCHSRRTFLAGITGSLAVAGLPAQVFAQGPDAVITRLADDMVVIGGVGGNVLAFNSSDGLILVDSGAVGATPALLDALGSLDSRRNSGSEVHTVFNTHWHLDQVGGNSHFGSHGARIIAHEKTRQYLSTPYYLFEEDRYQEAMPVEARPTETVYVAGHLTVGNEEIDYAHLQSAHTNGDIYVRFANANIIAAGDAVSPEIDPCFDWFSGGWVGGRVDALNTLLELCDEQTRIMPSFGPVVSRAEIEQERDFMQYMYDILVDQIRMGFDYRDSLASGIMDDSPRRLENPEKFLYDAHKGLWAHHNKLQPNIV